MNESTRAITPETIFQTGFAFWPSKVLLTAVELELFTALSCRTMTGEEIGRALDLHPRGIFDFLDALVALNFLERDGDGPESHYRNTAQTAKFLDKTKPEYVGGILEMASQRLFKFWQDLPKALRTGQPQNEVSRSQQSMFEELYRDPPRLEQFMNAMTGISRGNFQALAEQFDFSPYGTLLDVGGATGILSILVAQKFRNLKCLTFDLPQVEPIAQKSIAKAGLNNRIKTVAGDFFKDPLPKADVVTMGMILHDWNLEKKMHLIRAAYEALPHGGVFIAVENIIDDARRTNAFGLMMSLNMLIEFGDAFDFTFADFQSWCTQVGFRRCQLIPLAGPCSAAVAYKL